MGAQPIIITGSWSVLVCFLCIPYPYYCIAGLSAFTSKCDALVPGIPLLGTFSFLSKVSEPVSGKIWYKEKIVKKNDWDLDFCILSSYINLKISFQIFGVGLGLSRDLVLFPGLLYFHPTPPTGGVESTSGNSVRLYVITSTFPI